MELGPGHKRTEVGVIPDDWELTNLASVSSEPMQNGVFYKPSHKGAGVKLVNVGDLYGRIPIDTDSLELFDANESEIARFRVEDGDLLFTRSSLVPSGIAHCNIYKSDRIESVVFDSHVIRVRPDDRKVIPSYLFRFCLSSVARTYLISHAKTATMTTIDQIVLGQCPVFLPTSAEQEAIAEALSNTDALIESLEQLIAKKRQIKQGAMRELLTGERRLQVFANAAIGYEETEVGVIPEDWRLWELADLGSWKGGATPSMRNSMFWANGTIPWASSGDIKSALIRDTPMKITSAAIKLSSTTLLPPNSIMIVTRSGILRRYLPVAKNTVPIAINQDIKGLITNDNVVTEFVLHQLINNGGRILATCLKSGTTVESVDFSWLKAFKIPLPPTKDEQAAIADVLSDMDAEIATLEAKLAKARQLKEGMMHNLLTGRIRVV